MSPKCTASLLGKRRLTTGAAAAAAAGFLTADWYPAHVPDSLRKLLLSECKSQLLRAS